jgi:hypothetical protein
VKAHNTRANLNVVLLLTVLVLNTLYQSSLGGPGTMYNTAAFGVAALFVALNLRFQLSLLVAFGLPIVFLLLSIVANASTVSSGGLNSALTTGLSFLLLTLKPMPLNQGVLRRGIFVFLLTCLLLTIYTAVGNLKTGAVFGGNPNFNVNANGAALFLTSCLILALAFVRGRTLLLFAVAFGTFIVTTTSRAGMLVAAFVLTGFIFASKGFASGPFWKRPLASSRLLWLAAFATVPAMVAMLRPGVLEFIMVRMRMQGFGTAGAVPGTGRDVIWQTALGASGQTLTSVLFGYGPASAVGVIRSGTHSSYVEAFTSVGWPFLISSVVALLFLFRYHLQRGQSDFVLYGIAILLYGAVESVLFAGIGNIWFVMVLLSLYYRAAVPQQQEVRGHVVGNR